MKEAFNFIKQARNILTSFSLYIKTKFGWLGVPKIVPFLGFGNGTETYISGEVLEDNGISKPKEGQSKWRNFKTMVKRYLAEELAGEKVLVTFQGQTQIVVTDKYGIFNCYFKDVKNDIPDALWQKAAFTLPEKINNQQHSEIIEGEVMIIKKTPQYIVVSDIDDTILVSYATNKLMKFRLMFFNNALTRMPFEGISAFYRSLQRGTGEGVINPMFYLSNSEWNLYDLLYEFIQFNRIPKGPLLLREMAINFLRVWKMREYNKNHKTEKLRQLFTLYADVKFILIGDSGQKDPEVYSNIVKEFPGRVLAVYIRDLGLRRKVMRIHTLSESILQDFNTEMVIVKDTEAAARHAINKGFIMSQEFKSVVEEKQKDAEKKEMPTQVIK